VTFRRNRTMPAAAVMPVLVYPDVDAAADWLCNAFGFRERWRSVGKRAQLAVGDAAVTVVRGTAAAACGAHSIMVRVENADAHFARAQEWHATILSPPVDYPYGERQYTAEDPGGHRWTFSQSIDDVAPEEWGGESGPAL
jgi:uncharacterized glyoxalase superfamily protein PhnB